MIVVSERSRRLVRWTVSEALCASELEPLGWSESRFGLSEGTAWNLARIPRVAAERKGGGVVLDTMYRQAVCAEDNDERAIVLDTAASASNEQLVLLHSEVGALRRVWNTSPHEDDEELLPPSDSARVTIGTFRLLQPNEWLSDELINYYCGVLINAPQFDAVRRGVMPRMRVYCASTFLHPAYYMAIGTRKESRWKAQARWRQSESEFLHGSSLSRLGARAVFVPHHTGAHWCAFVLYINLGHVYCYESLPGANREQAQRVAIDLVSWLQHDFALSREQTALLPVPLLNNWRFYFRTPRMQPNASDCGVFTLLVARDLFLSAGLAAALNRREPGRPSSERAGQLRQLIALELLYLRVPYHVTEDLDSLLARDNEAHA